MPAVVGYDDPERAAKTLQRLTTAAGMPLELVAQLDVLCARSADPDGALQGAARALEARFERHRGPAKQNSLAPLVLIASASRFLASHLAARPRLLDLLAHPRFSRRARSASSAHKAALKSLRALDVGEPRDVERFHERLRQHKFTEVLRIALRDLSGRALIPESTAELSRLAASSFEAAVRFHYRRLCKSHGAPAGRTPDSASGFCVLGMGKLGGEELNFSSDVDVIYVYDQDGQTQGGALGALSHFAFYARLAEEVTRAVGAALAGGFVFRVDLDLRPEGRSGPLVNSLRSMEIYYEAQGAPWERFAWLKARPVAGTLQVGEEAIRRMQPFVYRKYLDLHAIEAMRAMKARAERESSKRGGVDLKLGPGGIREVEFFAQALQLLHGGRDANLRERNTLRALERLLFAGLITARDRDALAEAYLLLRKLEHRVQMVAERQTHQMPAEPQELERLARRSGFPTAAALDAELSRSRAEVKARFSDLLRVAGDGPDEIDAHAQIAADPLSSHEEMIDALGHLGFADAEAAALEVARMRKRRGTPFSPSAPPELAARSSWLVAELAKVPDPDRAIRHLADLFGQLAEPRATARLFAESPRTARLLLSLFGSSAFLSRSLLRHPELIDQLVHRGSAPLSRTRAELRASLQERTAAIPLDDAELQLSEMRRFHNEEILRIGLHDIAGALEPEAVGEQLSDLADVSVEACLAQATREIRARDGLLANAKSEAQPGLAVIALGKLGGRELGYHSDLDLIFLYSGEGETSGPHKVYAHEHFARIAQRMISHLTLALPEGTLYRIDARLRPSGNAGPLVASFDALGRYHSKAPRASYNPQHTTTTVVTEAPRVARLWERQALLRARCIAGDFELFDRADREVLVPSLYRPLDAAEREEAARELFTMRDRMEREIADESSARYNSKLGRGGLVDVEFAVQLLQLIYGNEHPGIRTQSTPAALAALAQEGLLAPAESEPLARGWRFLRRLESRLRIVRDRPISHLPREGNELAQLARRLGYSGAAQLASAALLSDYARATASVRAAFLRVVGTFTSLGQLPSRDAATSEP